MGAPQVNEGYYPAFDVLVAGGGMAGIAAAIASARSGARTALLERAGWLGGMGITGATGLHSFFNIFGAHEGAGPVRVADGIAQELVGRTSVLGGAVRTPRGTGHVRMERGGDFVSVLTPVEPECFKLAAAWACLESGVTLLLHTVLDEVRAEGGEVRGAVVWNKAGRSLIRARQYVDCTGDGDLAAWAGAPFEGFGPGDRGAYSAGFTFRLVNVDLAAMERDLEARGLITQLAHAVKPGMDAPDLVRIGIDMRGLRESGAEDAPGYFLASSLRPRELTYCNCVNHGPNDGLDPDALAAAETDLRGKMFEVAEFFQKRVAGCEQCYPAGPAPSVGQRRGRAIRCEYELTREDTTGAARFDDAVACFSFIDNPRDFVKDGGAYQIPFRALVPRGLANCLVAGRMMTVDTPAHNSTRNTVCCLVCGEAAGTAAAMAARAGVAPREIDTGELRARLEAAGAILEPRPEGIA